MKDRIRFLMEDQHLTQQSFAQQLGIAPATLCNIFNDRTKPTLNIVDAIKKKFPRVNLDWLLCGSGPVYINNEKDATPETSPSSEEGGSARGIESLAFDFDGDASDTSVSTPSASSVDSSHGIGNSKGAAGSLFDQPNMRSVDNTPKNMVRETVKYIDKPQRKITEIRIFYDDQTWETFVPKK